MTRGFFIALGVLFVVTVIIIVRLSKGEEEDT
jgi:hypothetical protein